MSPRRIVTPSAGARLRRTVLQTTVDAIETHVYDARP